MTNTKTQQQQHVVASPNPRVEEGGRTGAVDGELKATKVEPAAAVKAKPMKGKRKARTTKPRRQD